MFLLLFKPVGLVFLLHATKSPSLEHNLILGFVVQALILTIWILLPCLGEESLKSRTVKLPTGSLFSLPPHPGPAGFSRAGVLLPGDMERKTGKTIIFTQRLPLYSSFSKLHTLASLLLKSCWPLTFIQSSSLP